MPEVPQAVNERSRKRGLHGGLKMGRTDQKERPIFKGKMFAMKMRQDQYDRIKAIAKESGFPMSYIVELIFDAIDFDALNYEPAKFNVELKDDRP